MKPRKIRCGEILVTRMRQTISMPADTVKDAISYWRKNIESAQWFSPERENCIVLSLSTQLHAFCHSIVSIGSTNETTVHAREVFRPAIATNAYAIVLMHNHPSGDPAPSAWDKRMTKHLREAADMLLIRFVDHIIVGTFHRYKRPHYSFREADAL